MLGRSLGDLDAWPVHRAESVHDHEALPHGMIVTLATGTSADTHGRDLTVYSDSPMCLMYATFWILKPLVVSLGFGLSDDAPKGCSL